MRQHSKDWKICLSRGKWYLEARNPNAAYGCFEEAVRECPAENTTDLAMLLYYCGLSLEELGIRESAVECWQTSVRVDNCSGYNPAREKLGEYGRRPPDWKDRLYHTFRSLQTARYFQSAGRQRFRDRTEFERVNAVIDAYWRELDESGLLELVPEEERLDVLLEVHVDFGAYAPYSSPGDGGDFETGEGDKAEKISNIINFRTDEENS